MEAKLKRSIKFTYEKDQDGSYWVKCPLFDFFDEDKMMYFINEDHFNKFFDKDENYETKGI